MKRRLAVLRWLWLGLLWLALPLAGAHSGPTARLAVTPAPATLPRPHLYTGEQIDPDLGMYYLRARYYQPGIGRFWSLDSFEGYESNPFSLHKYLYCHANPVNANDPSGNEFSVVGVSVAASIGSSFHAMYDGGVSTAGFAIKDSIFGVQAGKAMDAVLIEHWKSIAATVGIGVAASYVVGKVARIPTGQIIDRSNELARSHNGARAALRNALGSGGGDAHHIISWQWRDHPLVQKAARGGFNFNGVENGVKLIRQHGPGGHPDYNDLIKGGLDAYHSLNSRMTDSQAAQLLKVFAESLRNHLKDLHVPLH